MCRSRGIGCVTAKAPERVAQLSNIITKAVARRRGVCDGRADPSEPGGAVDPRLSTALPLSRSHSEVAGCVVRDDSTELSQVWITCREAGR